MKKQFTSILSAFLLALTFHISAIAQTEPVAGITYRNTKVYTEDLSIDGAKLDKRIAKYYAESDLLKMNAKKVRRLNYIYLGSFTVVDAEKLPADVKNFISGSFDIGLYEKYRKADEKALVDVNMQGKKFKVELLSRKEVMKIKESIQ